MSREYLFYGFFGNLLAKSDGFTVPAPKFILMFYPVVFLNILPYLSLPSNIDILTLLFRDAYSPDATFYPENPVSLSMRAEDTFYVE